MNQKTHLLLVAAMAAPFCALAADSATPALPTKPVPPYELKHKATFSSNGITRNPFIPIGWKAPVAQVAVNQGGPKATVGADSFRVSSILLGGGNAPSLAIINERQYEEGQMIRMPKTGPQIAVRVFRISDGSVQLQVDNQIMTIPLRRGQLNDKQAEPQLNTERD
jgi:hypothetical protein